MNIIEFDSVMKYIEDMHWIYPVMEGRVTLLNVKKPEPKPDPKPEPKPNDSVPGSASPSAVSMSIIAISIVTLINLLQ